VIGDDVQFSLEHRNARNMWTGVAFGRSMVGHDIELMGLQCSSTFYPSYRIHQTEPPTHGSPRFSTIQGDLDFIQVTSDGRNVFVQDRAVNGYRCV